MPTRTDRKTTEWFALKVVDVLVEECGLNPQTWEDIQEFLTSASGQEFRFQGGLGFGGKLWNKEDKIIVSMYREDAERFPERGGMIDRANVRLVALYKTEFGS